MSLSQWKQNTFLSTFNPWNIKTRRISAWIFQLYNLFRQNDYVISDKHHLRLFICCIFNDSVSKSYYIAFDGRIVNNECQRMRKEAVWGYIGISLSWRETWKPSIRKVLCSGRYWNKTQIRSVATWANLLAPVLEFVNTCGGCENSQLQYSWGELRAIREVVRPRHSSSG
jgi:hypothetical protein